MDEDVDIGDMGTPRVVNEAYELEHFNSPSHTVFSLQPHSPSVTVVLSDTSQHFEASMDATIPPGTEETEAEATSAHTAAAPEASAPTSAAQNVEADSVTPEAQPMESEARVAEPEAENSTN